MAEQLATGDTSLLAELHATTSGLKVLVTTACAQDIETARRALGGHGFSAYAGIGRIYADYLPAATYVALPNVLYIAFSTEVSITSRFEGDNYLLDQQVVRAALKTYKRITSSQKERNITALLSPSTAYLRLLAKPVPPFSQDSWGNTHACVLLLEHRALALVRSRALHENDADASADQRVSRAVTEAFVAEQLEGFINGLRDELPGKNASVVRNLLHLCILSMLESALVDLLSFALISTPSHANQDDVSLPLRKEIQRLCLALLPQAVALSDAFGFSDWELDSALGVYDGNVYETLWQKAQTEPLNRGDVVDGYEVG
ncbi:hypothetical protein EIP86_007675 [Pleurotus ostreatoroseus]|nr:hypothetical protein EIP86_007675 [Pleurotus ostreatoroseus]